MRARGEKLLFYPLMTQMTQIFWGCVVQGKLNRAAAEMLKARTTCGV
ncbi:MAG TPA: hypothetical protein PK717_07935 [Caldisericia bacterium]|nr:hypothetical protein [Caldisericia bacterium]